MKMQKLTKDQTIALSRLEEFASCRGPNKWLFTGPAGSGKTFILSKWLTAFPNINVVVAAPTHKARQVLQERLIADSLSVPTRTVHQLLNMRPQLNENNVETFDTKDDPQEFEIHKYAFVVIDECSMISTKLWQNINRADYSGNILFCGDTAQLPPVGEKFSPIFKALKPSLTLRDIVRHDSDILELVSAFRAAMFRSNGKELLNFPYPISFSNKKDLVSHYVRESCPNSRILCWTNQACRDYNSAVRVGLGYKSPYEVGELIVTTNFCWAYKNGVLFQLYTNTDLTVKEVAQCYKDGKRLHKLTCDMGGIDIVLYRFINLRHSYWSELKCARVAAINAPTNEDIQQYYQTLASYHAAIGYAYALTIHKSQGSTFLSVYLDLHDIKQNKNLPERYRCIYTGLTRAADTLLIYG